MDVDFINEMGKFSGYKSTCLGTIKNVSIKTILIPRVLFLCSINFENEVFPFNHIIYCFSVNVVKCTATAAK